MCDADFHSVSALSVLVWDTILLLPDEYRIVWRRAPMILRIGYVVNKYGSIVALISLLTGEYQIIHHIRRLIFLKELHRWELLGGPG